MIADLAAHPLVQQAARIAHVFHLDPVALLDNGGDQFVAYVRIAAAKIVNDDERRSAEESRKSSGGRGRRGRRR